MIIPQIEINQSELQSLEVHFGETLNEMFEKIIKIEKARDESVEKYLVFENETSCLKVYDLAD